MKIFLAGARFYAGQVDRIESGFRELGHEITENIEEAQLCYSNDESHYSPILEAREKGLIRGRVILNVLDIPTFLSDYSVDQLRIKLMSADAVTAISRFTQQEVSKYCALEPQVVYNPVKPVYRGMSFLGVQGQYRIRYLSAGRRFDKNKRSSLWVEALQILGVDPHEVALVGGEPGWGNPLGVLDDKSLATVYESVDFVMATGKNEGLCLPMAEGMAAAVIPVLCNDLTTREEFLPSTLFPEYLEVEPTPLSVARFIARYLNNDSAMDEMKERLYQHYQKNWKEKLSGRGVAAAILKVYEGLK